MSGSGKVGFAAGLCVGLLAGSRAGRGLYDKSAATAGALVRDPRVRRGATTAAQRAGEAGTAMAGAAARQVKRARSGDEDEDERDTRDASVSGSGTSAAAPMRSGTGMMAGDAGRHWGRRHRGGGEMGEDARSAARSAGARDASAGMRNHPTPANMPATSAASATGSASAAGHGAKAGETMTGRGTHEHGHEHGQHRAHGEHGQHGGGEHGGKSGASGQPGKSAQPRPMSGDASQEDRGIQDKD